MTVIKRVPDNIPYTVIGNHILQNDNLSLTARGLLAYLISKPPDFQIRVDQLRDHFQEGRRRVTNALEELKESGFLKKQQIRNDKGQVKSWQWIISQEPQNPDVQMSTSSHLENEPEKPDVQMSTSSHVDNYINKRNKDEIKYYEEIKEIDPPFEIWWKAWRASVKDLPTGNAVNPPGKKAPARKAYESVAKKISSEKIDLATKHYLQELKSSGQSNCHASTFLNLDNVEQYQEPPLLAIRGKPQEQPRRLTAQEQSVKRMVEDYEKRHGETGDSGFGNGFDEFESTHTGRIAQTLGSSLLQ